MKVARLADGIVAEIIDGLPDTLTIIHAPERREMIPDPDAVPPPELPAAPAVEGTEPVAEADRQANTWHPPMIAITVPAETEERPATVADWFPGAAEGTFVQIGGKSVQIGDRWDGTAFKPPPPLTKAEIAAKSEAELAARRQAMVVSAAQLAGALYLGSHITAAEAEGFAASGEIPAGLMSAIDAALAASGITGQAASLARIKLKGATEYRRASPLTPVIGAALSLDALALDQLFLAAAALD